MVEKELMQQSTKEMYAILQSASAKDKNILIEYNFLDAESHKTFFEIGDRIRVNASNDVATIFRGGEGVHYLEIVRDVAEKIEVKYSETDNVEKIEQEIFIKVINDVMKKMSDDERQQFEASLHNNGIGKQGMSYAEDDLRKMFMAGVMPVIGLQLFQVVAAQVARGVLGRAVLAFPPLGVAMPFMGGLLLYELLGPAYRCTIPTVIQLAYMRQMKKYNELR